MLYDFVDFETAVLLKKKGWVNTTYPHCWVKLKEADIYSYADLYDHSDKEVIMQPCIAQVVDWLHYKYGIWITVTSISQESWQCHMCRKGDPLGKCYLEDFASYKEAYIEAIKYCLVFLI